MVDDVGDLLGIETRVDGMANNAASRESVIQFKVAVIVPGQRTDAVTGFDPQTLQSIGQFSRARECIAERVALIRIIQSDRNDFAIRVVGIGKSHQ